MRSAQLSSASSASSASSSSSSAAARPLSSVMFSLLMGLWNYLFSKAELHLLIVGLDDAGKTTLLEQLKGIFGKKPGIPLDKIPPTVGLNIARVDIQRCRIIFWDLGGQERLRVIWSKYYSESHGIVFVLDSVNERRFEEAKQTLQTMLEHSELRAIPLLLLANKKDLENAIGVNAMRDLMAVDTHSGPVGAYATCALTREGIEESMNWFVDTVKNSDRFYQRQSSSSTS